MREVKPEEREEFAKRRRLEAIDAGDAGLNQHERKIQNILLLVLVLDVVLLALVVYQILGHN